MSGITSTENWASQAALAVEMLLLEPPTNTALLQIELPSSADYSSHLPPHPPNPPLAAGLTVCVSVREMCVGC